MRVFVTGTGRCGTTTFSKACSHITNFTSGHETHWNPGFDNSKVHEFPDNHIEVDPHLFWHLGSLMWKYPDAYWVHLVRARESCIDSLMKTSGIHTWMKLAYVGNTDLRQACGDYYDSTNKMIGDLFETVDFRRTMHLENLVEEWDDFWEWIGAEGDYGPAVAELSIKHNAR